MKGTPGSAAKALRWAKTLFFLLSMVSSFLLVSSPPLLVGILDLLLPPALLRAAVAVAVAVSVSGESSNPLSASSITAAQLRGFQFSSSLVDLPILSAARSFLILCAYGIWGGKGGYLVFTAMCGSVSVIYVVLKAAVMYGGFPAIVGEGGRRPEAAAAAQALMMCSVGLGAFHVAAAYRSSCRERRKLLVYKIDIEAAPYRKAMASK